MDKNINCLFADRLLLSKIHLSEETVTYFSTKLTKDMGELIDPLSLICRNNTIIHKLTDQLIEIYNSFLYWISANLLLSSMHDNWLWVQEWYTLHLQQGMVDRVGEEVPYPFSCHDGNHYRQQKLNIIGYFHLSVIPKTCIKNTTTGKHQFYISTY